MRVALMMHVSSAGGRMRSQVPSLLGWAAIVVAVIALVPIVLMTAMVAAVAWIPIAAALAFVAVVLWIRARRNA